MLNRKSRVLSPARGLSQPEGHQDQPGGAESPPEQDHEGLHRGGTREGRAAQDRGRGPCTENCHRLQVKFNMMLCMAIIAILVRSFSCLCILIKL